MTPRPNILVVGAGYVGLATAVFLADKGFPTTVVEKNSALVETLRRGRLHFRERLLAERLREVIGERTLMVAEPEKALYQRADLIFIAIDSANRKTWQMRTATFAEIAAWIGEVRRKTAPTVVLKSTNVLGFAGEFRRLLDAAPFGKAVKLVVNPEFLREGNALEDTARPFRIVIGSREKRDAARLAMLYRQVYRTGVPIVHTDWTSAELIKLASNVYLAYRLAFIHEIADFARREGLDLEAIRMGIGLDQRIGLDYFTPGLGFGGSCLPKDCLLINSRETGNGFTFQSAQTAMAVNEGVLENLVKMLAEKLGGLAGKKIALLGAAFKPDVDDTRDSHAVRLAELLKAKRAKVAIYEPYLAGRDRIPETEFALEKDVAAALDGAAAVIIGTAHKRLAMLRPREVAALVANKLVIDYFRVLNRGGWREAGFEVIG
ncbi:MAG TPA: nucleotide sugar dehydrogenase [candidate division Zixibacteria bacterium]|nr:nucleotide sugar dehydrogenase [candidate division Zixibacteria bacterium]